MSYAETRAAMAVKRAQIAALQGEMRALQNAVEPEVVADYQLVGWDGPVRLSELDIVCHRHHPVCTRI